jgi:hypothetical protein
MKQEIFGTFLIIIYKVIIKYLNSGLEMKIDIWFNPIDIRFKPINIRFNPIDIRFKLIDILFNPIDIRFKQIDILFNPIDIRFKPIDIRFKLMSVLSIFIIMKSILYSTLRHLETKPQIYQNLEFMTYRLTLLKSTDNRVAFIDIRKTPITSPSHLITTKNEYFNSLINKSTINHANICA